MDMNKRAVSQPSADEKPLAAPPTSWWGSDAIAAALRALDVPYIALVPGASYRGLHDSLVNFLGNERPQMLVCLHEEHTVAIAHGYYRVRERMMAAGAARERRPDARGDVDLQRLVRPRAGARARRDRAGGRGEAPAVDRLDPHRARPGRAGARLHQVGRPALVGRRRAGIAAARRAAREHRALRPGVRLPRRRAAGIAPRRVAAVAGCRALHAAAAGAAGGGARAARGAAPRRGEASGHSRRPRRPRARTPGGPASRSPRSWARAC